MPPSRTVRPAARLALLLTVALLALPAGAAFARHLPPQRQTTSLPTWQIVLLGVGGIGVLTGIVIVIMRDARRRAPVSAGDDQAAHLAADAHKRGQATKQKQRAKSKAARAQRRRNR